MAKRGGWQQVTRVLSTKSYHDGKKHFYYKTQRQRDYIILHIVRAEYRGYVNNDMNGDQWTEGMRKYLNESKTMLPINCELSYDGVKV